MLGSFLSRLRRPLLSLRFVLVSIVFGSLLLLAGIVSLVLYSEGRRISEIVLKEQLRAATSRASSEVGRLLRVAPLDLQRYAELAEQGVLPLGNPDVLAEVLIADLRRRRNLAWLSYSDRTEGWFIGVTRRDGALILNRSAPDVNGGRPVEDRIGEDGRRTRLDTAPAPFDPRTQPWFLKALDHEGVLWTQPYRFNEGVKGISATLRVRDQPSGPPRGVITADFRIDTLSEFIGRQRVGKTGEGFLIDPSLSGMAAVVTEERAAGASVIEQALVAGLAKAGSRLMSVAHTESIELRLPMDGRTIIVSFQPLMADEVPPWLLAVVVPAEDLDGFVEIGSELAIGLAGLALIVAVGFGSWLAGRVSQPLRAISADLERIGRFNLTEGPTPPSLIYEVTVVGAAVDRMKAGLRSFSRYVPGDLVRSVLATGHDAKLSAEARDMTILFADLARFTRIAEMLSDAVAELGGYFELMDLAVTRQGGTIDKFMGDGVLAFFNAPSVLPDHPQHACRAALDAMEQLARYRARQIRDGRPAFDMRIGLALGPVLVGNIGTPRRFAYTVIGDAVNLASRLEVLNKFYGTSIIASADLIAAVGPHFEWRRLDRVAVAGRAATTELGELLGIRGETDPALIEARDIYETAFAAYLAGDFEAAEAGFTAAERLRPADRAAGILRCRCAELKLHPPAAGWDGVFVHLEK
jgi:adenylate cyclase